MTLSCLHGPSGSAVEQSGGNLCVLYEFDSCGAARRFHDTVTVPDPSTFSEKCGMYKNASTLGIAACFCKKDNCNTDANVQVWIGKQIDSLSSLPSVGTWASIAVTSKTKDVLSCMRKNLDTSEEEEDDTTTTIVMIISISAGVFIFCCCFLPVAYHLKEKHRKKRLAETWDQRVKEAAEELSKSDKLGSIFGTGTGSSEASDSKAKKKKKKKK